MSSQPDHDLLDAADRIGARLCRDAVRDGRRWSWVGGAEVPQADGTFTLLQRALGPDLYEGTSGVALFLGSLHAATGEPVYRRAALGAAVHALSRLDAVAPAARLGLHSGWPGIALSVAQAGHDCGEPDLAAPAVERLAGLGQDLPPDEHLDVMSGDAGAIPALLHLAGGAGAAHAEALETLALRAGDRLLAAATRTDGGASWATIGQPPEAHLCGYSHGAAGIAVALLELWAHTGEERFAEVAGEAFAFEAALFSPQHGSWPDRRTWLTGSQGGLPAFSVTWCHGSSGGALARFRAIELRPDDARRAEAELALQACIGGAGDGSGDATPCHGWAGPGEALLTGARVLGDPALAGHAAAAARRVVARAEATGGIYRSGLMSGAHAHGLMLGAAGVGHHLLRLVAPDAVPPILITPGTRRAAPVA